MAMWTRGQVIVRREVLGLGLDFPGGDDAPPWLLRPWAAVPVYVIEHDDDALVTYLPEAAELGVAEGDWPTSDGRHPWHHRRRWEGHGVVMVQQRGEPYSVWHFWAGPDRTFSSWYVNLQAPYAESPIGFDTQDFELDLVVAPDRTWTLKDDELLDQRVAEGRFRPEHAAWIRGIVTGVTAKLDAGTLPWSDRWTGWRPPPTWRATTLPAGWQDA